MDNRLYELMNWPRIEALVYSEEDEPQEILGPHKTEAVSYTHLARYTTRIWRWI